MKKFKFRLERVRQYRDLVKQEKLRELLICHHKLEEDRARLMYLKEEQLRGEVNEGAVISVSEIELWGNYGERLREEIERQHEEIKDSERRVVEARAAYIEASKDAEALEKLKKKKHEQFNELVQKEDEKFLDELAVQRQHSRSLKEEN